MHQQFWPPSLSQSETGCHLEFRANLAWGLLERFALVAANNPTREDSSGRAVHELLPAQEAVDRCFELADAFVDKAVQRKEIRQYTDAEQEAAFRRSGELVRIRDLGKWEVSEADEEESTETA